jgi:hypothetical protein
MKSNVDVAIIQQLTENLIFLKDDQSDRRNRHLKRLYNGVLLS